MSEAQFRKGQWVEVSSNEEGFRGAWFVAKVIRLPLGWNDDDAAAAAAAAASASKTTTTTTTKLIPRKDEFLVEYKSIMEDEQGTKRLREYVHTSCTRPLPPKEPGRLFELNEFVDAFDRDGWWKGVITQVFDKEFKYVVYFKSTKEKLEFLQSDLRVHLEWIDGQWSKPRKQHQQHQEIKQDDAEGSKKNVKKRGRPAKEKSPSEQGKVVCKSKETDKRSIRSSKKRRGNATKYKVKDKGSGLKAFGPQANYDADMSINEVLRDIADEFQSPPVTDNEDVASRKNPSVVSTRILSNIADEYQSPPMIDNKGKLASKSNNAATEEDPSVRTEISRDTADEHQSSPMIDSKGISPDGILASKSNNAATEEDPSVKTEISRDTADEHQSSPMIDSKGISPDGILASKSNNAATEEDPSVRTEISRDTADEHQSSPMIDNKGISPDGILASKSNNAATEEDPSVRTEISRDTADEYQSPPIIDNKGISPDGILVSKSNNSVTEEDPSSRTEVLRDTADEHQSSPMIDKKGISPNGIPVSKSNNAATEEDPSSRTEILRDTADEHLSPMIDEKATEEDPSSGTEILRDTADDHQSSPMIDKKEISPDKLSQSNEVATKEDTLLKDLEIPESFNLTKSPEEDTCIGTLCNEAIKEQNEMGPASVDDQCKVSRKVEKEVTLASVYNRCDKASAKQNQMESSVNHETRKECDEVPLEAPVIGSTNDKVSVENESLSFVKTSLMWERILSMEIFHKMPQRPHFRPLKRYNMAQREGMAIGHMVTFANVVAKTHASHIDDPRSNLEEMSKALVDLKAHGFNVQAIQSRVQRLLEMKDKQLMLEKKSKEDEVKIIELKNEKDKFKTQLDKVKENLRFHEEATIRYKNEHEVLMKEMDRIGLDTSVCLMELNATADNSKSVKLEYPSVAAGPW